MAAWLNRITVSASCARIVKLCVSVPASISPNPNGPSTIPNATKISAGATYQRFTSPETTA